MSTPSLRSLFLLLAFSATACHHRPKTISFYYWRTTFALDSTEQKALRDNSVQSLYIRYFDVDWPANDTLPSPVTPIHFDSIPTGYTIVPVVFFRNRVFQQITPDGIPALVDKVWALVRRINASAQLHPQEIQFDCDWTDKTKDRYFTFLRRYKQTTGLTLSATIRLHQVKYPDRTGIPPVDHGTLMFYNMGNIDAGPGSSIYDRTIAHRYTPSLRSYPLTLDLALPVFSWALLIRNGKVVQLLDKMNEPMFDKDTNFACPSPNRYLCFHACFKKGYYFQQNDDIKIESVSSDNLREIVTEVNRHTNHRIRNLIFFDLDRQNLLQYDKHLFKKIRDHTD
ncbi:hypothetical protein [Puia sp.]|uniref:hypothetical protein n=1 Tax=Puia sp. TaxID=2045100 RepID=UPI002F418DF6